VKPGDGHHIPPLVAWDSDRGTRGTGSERTPRCTTRGCPIRYPSGPDRDRHLD